MVATKNHHMTSASLPFLLLLLLLFLAICPTAIAALETIKDFHDTSNFIDRQIRLGYIAITSRYPDFALWIISVDTPRDGSHIIDSMAPPVNLATNTGAVVALIGRLTLEGQAKHLTLANGDEAAGYSFNIADADIVDWIDSDGGGMHAEPFDLAEMMPFSEAVAALAPLTRGPWDGAVVYKPLVDREGHVPEEDEEVEGLQVLWEVSLLQAGRYKSWTVGSEDRVPRQEMAFAGRVGGAENGTVAGVVMALQGGSGNNGTVEEVTR